jgi:hypothetical protein
MNRNDELISASEIAAWAWCPESWRLEAFGHKRYALTALFERWSVLAIRFGVWLLGAAILLAALAFVLEGGQ